VELVSIEESAPKALSRELFVLGDELETVAPDAGTLDLVSAEDGRLGHPRTERRQEETL